MSTKGDSGQWILLSAVIISIALGALIFLLNTAMLTGHSSTSSVMAVPKDAIRDLRYQSITEAIIIGNDVNSQANMTSRNQHFNTSYNRYIEETKNIYSTHSTIVNLIYVPYMNDSTPNAKIDNVSLIIVYDDGKTFYSENSIVGLEKWD